MVCCLVLDGWSNLWPLLYLAEEAFLLGQCSLLPATRHLPQPFNLYAFSNIYLFLVYLTSSGMIYSPIPSSRPFIPTIAHGNSLFCSSRKKGGFWFLGNCPSHSYVTSFCTGVFLVANRHASDVLAFGTLQHLLQMASCPPRSMVWWKSYGGETLWGFGWELSRLLFLPLYILLENSDCSTFCIFNSQESVRGALLYFRKLPLVLLLSSRIPSSLTIPPIYTLFP